MIDRETGHGRRVGSWGRRDGGGHDHRVTATVVFIRASTVVGRGVIGTATVRVVDSGNDSCSSAGAVLLLSRGRCRREFGGRVFRW